MVRRFYCTGRNTEFFQVGCFSSIDSHKALNWYLLSAKQGDAYAQIFAALMYKENEGIERNYPEAIRWFELAAAQGLADAQLQLGFMHSHGLGVTKDYAEARRWYIKAAEQNDDLALSYIGIMYELGQGVSQDNVKAYMWFRLSADKGNKYSQEYIDEISRCMTQKQIVFAELLANECKARNFKSCD
jgi:TPR repeat protein